MIKAIIYLLGSLLLLSGCSSINVPTDRSKSLADIAAAAVVMKHNMNHIKPEERWRYIAYTISPDLEELGYSPDQIKKLAQDIVNDGPYTSIPAEILTIRERYKRITDPNDLK